MTSPAAAETPTEPANTPFLVQGRRFRAREKTTGRQDMYVMGILEGADFERLRDQMGDDGSLSDLAKHIITNAYQQDTLYDLVGAILEEVDERGQPLPLVDGKGRPQKWTKENAEAIGNFIANLDDEEEKGQFSAMISGVLVMFFTTGVAAWTGSRNSSAAPATIRLDSSETPGLDSSSPGTDGHDPLLAQLLAAGDLDPTISASGTTSSAPSPATTPTATTASSTGI